MKKTLTAIAFFGALATSAANASMPAHAANNEGLQNYYYYFGAPCCNRPMGMAGPCGAVAAAAPCGETCEPCMAPIEYEQVCTTTCCDPCASRWNVLNPFSYFG